MIHEPGLPSKHSTNWKSSSVLRTILPILISFGGKAKRIPPFLPGLFLSLPSSLIHGSPSLNDFLKSHILLRFPLYWIASRARVKLNKSEPSANNRYSLLTSSNHLLTFYLHYTVYEHSLSKM